MFADLKLANPLLKALEKLGLDKPTEVQAKTLPEAMAGHDLLVNAETGSGKTAAFLLPTFHHLLTEKGESSGTRALILSPTRELARQLFKNAKDLAQFSPLNVGLLMGGDEFKYQKALIRKDPEVIIATPGRLLEHIDRGNTELSNLEFLVLDEADRMLDMGLSDTVLSIAKVCRPERQTMLFSATLAHTGVRKVAAEVLRDPKSLTLSTAQSQHSAITQQVILADDAPHKERLLSWLLANETYDKALIFTNTRDYTSKLGSFLEYHNIAAGVLHGEMEQDQRNQVMTQLRYGKIRVLVATDLAARGLDIKGIDLVINVDMARSGDDYIHRVGRTGRAGATGTAITFITAADWNLMNTVERYLQIRFEKRSISELEAKFKGPKKLKSSGKAAGKSKKEKDRGSDNKKTGTKVKARLRDKKNIGKRRKPSQPSTEGKVWGDNADGWAPMKKKPKPETE